MQAWIDHEDGAVRARRACRRTWATVVFALLLAAGCGSRELKTDYGVRFTGRTARSLNGIDVLADAFVASDFRVATWRRLSPGLSGRSERHGRQDSTRAYRTIVWAPDSFGPHSLNEIEFLQSWISEGGTLIYIGRDYDAEPAYWRDVTPAVSPEEKSEAVRREALARSAFDARRNAAATPLITPWFVMDYQASRQQVGRLSGRWTEKLTTGRVNLSLGTTLRPPAQSEWDGIADELRDAHPYIDLDLPETEVLLAADGEPLVLRATHRDWRGGQVLAVADGSTLLNYPQLRPGHQQMAAELVRACGPAGRVALLESGTRGLRVHEVEPGMQTKPTRREPLATIMDHAMVLGILACFVIMPIFGRPRDERDSSRSDFGKHVVAIGELMGRTNDLNYAKELLHSYQQQANED